MIHTQRRTSPALCALAIVTAIFVVGCSPGESGRTSAEASANAAGTAVDAPAAVPEAALTETSAEVSAGTTQSTAMDESMRSVVEFSGGAHAAAEHCGTGGNAAELQSMKEQQKQHHIQSGGTADGYEAAFAAGYDKAARKFQGASAAERQQACAQLEQLQQLTPEQLLQQRR